jgi:hypothetical protein
MRLHSLKHEKRIKIVLNSKWRQNPRWMPKFVFEIASTEFHLFQKAFLRSFYFDIARLFQKFKMTPESMMDAEICFLHSVYRIFQNINS